jgi:hypothetical protein
MKEHFNKMKLIIFLLFIAVVETVAQEPAKTCVTNRNAPPINAYYWPPDTKVKVYFHRGMFTPEQRKALRTAMTTWSDTAAQTGAGVSFSYTGEVDQVAKCDGCLTVTRREVHKHNRKAYAFFNPSEQDSSAQLRSAWIDFDFATTKPEALQGFMVHELGHGMGLLDCKTCKKNKTIMDGFSGINSDDHLAAPSDCDLEVVRQVYKLVRRVNNNPVARKK